MNKIILIALVALASCSKSIETSLTTSDSEVRISSSIATRTIGDTWEDDDAIGVYMTTNEGTTLFDLGTNVKYTTTSVGEDNSLGNFTSTTPLYYPASDKVDLLAYYPYSDATTSAGIFAVNVTSQTDQGAIDLMVESITGQTKSDQAIAMIFDHKLSRIALTITADGGLVDADLRGLVVTLSGTATTADFDLTAEDESAISNTDNIADITMLTTTDDDGVVISAEAIVIPQGGFDEAPIITFKTDNNRYTATITTSTFEIGQQYLYNVTIKNTGTTISSPTISDWGNGTEGEEDGDDELSAEPVTTN